VDAIQEHEMTILNALVSGPTWCCGMARLFLGSSQLHHSRCIGHTAKCPGCVSENRANLSRVHSCYAAAYLAQAQSCAVRLALQMTIVCCLCHPVGLFCRLIAQHWGSTWKTFTSQRSRRQY
jgi:hypothetical protein